MSVRLSGGGGGGSSGSSTSGTLLGSNITVSATNSILADTTISIPQSVATNASVVFSSVSATNINSASITVVTIACTNLTATNMAGPATSNLIGSNIVVSASGGVLSSLTISIPQAVATNSDVKFSTVTATSLGSLNISTTNMTFTRITGTTATPTSLGCLNISTTNLTGGTVTVTSVTATSLGSLNVSTTNLTFGTITGTTVTATSLGSLNISTTNFQGSSVTSSSVGCLNLSATNLQATTATFTSVGCLNLSATNLQSTIITATSLSNASVSNIVGSGITYVMDGGGSVLTTGQVKGYVVVPYSATVTNLYLIGDQIGSVGIDIWKAAYSATNLPTNGNSIFGSFVFSLNNVQAYSVASGFTGSVLANDVLAFYIDTVATVTNVALNIILKKV